VYPLFSRLLAFVIPSAWLASWLVANAAFFVGQVFLYQWARLRWPHDVAVRLLLLVAVFPFAYFFFTAYAESVFFALAVASLYLAERRYWAWAIALAGLAAVTRPVGPALVLALIILAVQHRNRRVAASSLLALIPLLTFIAYLGVAFGHPLSYVAPHSDGWLPPRGDLFTTLSLQFHTHLSPFDRIDAAASVLFLLSAILVWRRVGPAYAAFVVAATVLPLLHGLVSMERYVIVLFPVMAAWATVRNRTLGVGIVAICLSGFVLFSTLFADGYSVF
jgi:hypothetical protein